MSKIKGVIFDFNGTLFFDTPFHEQAWREYARRLCHREVTDEEFRDHVHGRTNAQILAYLVGEGMSQPEIDRHGEAKEAIYRELCLSNPADFHLAEGAEAYLDEMKRRGVPMAIATSSGYDNVAFYMEHFRMARWFDKDTFIYHDGQMRSKPYPDIYLRASAALGLPPEACMVFEDMPSGIAAARAAGVGCIIAVASALSPAYLASLDGVERVIRDYTGLSVDDVTG